MEREITVAEGNHKVTITVSNARVIQIFNGKGELIGKTESDKMIAPQIFYLEGDTYQVSTDGQIDDILIEAAQFPTVIEFAQLLLTSDAKDFHVVDGIGEIPADMVYSKMSGTMKRSVT